MHCTVTALLLCRASPSQTCSCCSFTRLLRVGFLRNCRQLQEKVTHFCFEIHLQCPGLLPRKLSCFVLRHKKIVTRQDGWFESIIIKQSWQSRGLWGGQEGTKVLPGSSFDSFSGGKSEAEQRDLSTGPPSRLCNMSRDDSVR